MPKITIHDEYGFTQAHRRALLEVLLANAAHHFAEAGRTMDVTEEADGVTILLDGELFTRVLWTELIAIEQEGLSAGEEGGG